ncbi:MAG: hypothetical protein JSW27_11050, partial [Phycisphaerales bacterium]
MSHLRSSLPGQIGVLINTAIAVLVIVAGILFAAVAVGTKLLQEDPAPIGVGLQGRTGGGGNAGKVGSTCVTRERFYVASFDSISTIVGDEADDVAIPLQGPGTQG